MYIACNACHSASESHSTNYSTPLCRVKVTMLACRQVRGQYVYIYMQACICISRKFKDSHSLFSGFPSRHDHHSLQFPFELCMMVGMLTCYELVIADHVAPVVRLYGPLPVHADCATAYVSVLSNGGAYCLQHTSTQTIQACTKARCTLMNLPHEIEVH